MLTCFIKMTGTCLFRENVTLSEAKQIADTHSSLMGALPWMTRMEHLSKTFHAFHKLISARRRMTIKPNNPSLPTINCFPSSSPKKNKTQPCNFRHLKRQIPSMGLTVEEDAKDSVLIKTSHNCIKSLKSLKGF